MQKIKLHFDWFFVAAASASYFFGVVVARFSGRPLKILNLAAGLLIFFSFYLLQKVQIYMTSNRVNPFTKVRGVGESQSATALTLILAGFFGVFAGMYFLLQAKVLIGVNMMLIIALAVLMFLSLGRFSRLFTSTMSWLFEGLVVSPILFLLGSSVQEYQFTPLLFLLWMPLFFLYGVSAITLLFSEYDKSSSARSNSFIASVGWEKALRFHHALILLCYVSLFIYILTSNTWSRNWPALLLSIVSGLEVFLLEQMAGGMRPNWKLIRALAIVQFFSLIYLLTYPLLIQ